MPFRELIFIPAKDHKFITWSSKQGRMKRNTSILIILIAALLLLWQYDRNSMAKEILISGSTMGTTYNVKYIASDGADLHHEIDSLLLEVNQALSTYIPDSEISRFNRGDRIIFESAHLPTILRASTEIYQQTGGAFNPAVMTLVNAWGFGPEGHKTPDSTTVDSLLSTVDFPSVKYNSVEAKKTKLGVQLDFSAIAKGYGVDVIAQYLQLVGIQNYMVDIGGEVICKGVNQQDQIWRIGINKPYEEAPLDSWAAVVQLKDRAIATSGNYRNYYVKDGVKYAHTIDPVSGYPVQHSLLSASVFSYSCMVADAYATGFMVMGLENAIRLVEQMSNLEAVLIYNNRDGEMQTFISEGIKDFVSFTQ